MQAAKVASLFGPRRRTVKSETLQHDDHIWLTVGGDAWAIQSIHGPLIMLWRGYAPHLEYAMVDVANVDWAAYCACAEARLR